MTNRTAPALERPRGAKMWMRVYTVTRAGIVSPPAATVSVPYSYEPATEPMNTELAPCACPGHRQAATR